MRQCLQPPRAGELNVRRRRHFPFGGDDMGNIDLFYLAFLFGIWLAVVASINYISVLREASGQRTPRVRTVRRWTLAVGIGLVTAYFSVALPAYQLLPADSSYS